MNDNVVNFSVSKLNRQISTVVENIINSLPEESPAEDVATQAYLHVYAGYTIINRLISLLPEDKRNEMSKETIKEFFDILGEFKSGLEQYYGNLNVRLNIEDNLKLQGGE